MSNNDSRMVVGGLVHAKACHVTCDAECKRRYGSLFKTKLVNGVVTMVETVTPANKKRVVTMITASYTFGGGEIKVQKLNSRSVKAGHVPATNVEGNEPVTGIGTQIAQAPNESDTAPDVNAPGVDPPFDRNDDASPSYETLVNEIVAAGVAENVLHNPEEMREDFLMRNDDDAPPPDETIAYVHGNEWVRAAMTNPPLNGNVPFRQWSVRNLVGEVLHPGQNNLTTAQEMSPLDFFLLMFPPKQLSDMVHWTNRELVKLDLKQTTESELLKLFGMFILMSRFEFTSRHTLW